MTTGQIMMKLREIEVDLDEGAIESAQMTLCSLIEQMLVDDRRHTEARTMGDVPFDGGERVKL